MKWKMLNKAQALSTLEKEFDEYGDKKEYSLPLTKNETELKAKLLEAYRQAVKENDDHRDYGTDLFFALSLYDLFSTGTYKMTLHDAATADIWRYLCVVIAPEIIMDRWHKQGSKIPLDHFCTKPHRIYFKSLWWYIFLSWQGNRQDTLQILRHNSTDTILNLVERSGTAGYQADVYRAIMYKFSEPGGELKAHDAQLFRKVMKLHTAWSANIEPVLYAGGIAGYVKELFAYFS